MPGGSLRTDFQGQSAKSLPGSVRYRRLKGFGNLALDRGVNMAMKDFVEFSGAVFAAVVCTVLRLARTIPATSASARLSCQQGGHIDRHTGSVRDGA